MQRMQRWTHRLIMICLISLLLLGLWLNIVPPLVRAATAPGQRVQSLARVALPGGELAVVVQPAQARRNGEVALWWVGKGTPRVETLARMAGYPASR